MKTKIINNKKNLLIDEIKKDMNFNYDAKSIINNFSIFAFKELQQELEKIIDYKIIFTSKNRKKISDFNGEEFKNFFLEFFSNEEGDKYQIKLKNNLEQKHIASKMAQWIKEKVQIKQNTNHEQFDNFSILNNDNESKLYLGMQSFDLKELGKEKTFNSLHNILSFSSKDTTLVKSLENDFDYNWENNKDLIDVKKEILSFLENAYKENSPYFIYILMLFNLFKSQLNEEENFKGIEGLYNSKIWEILFNFQKDAVKSLISKLEKYNGCILADAVGLGKTFTTLGVMKYYSSLNKRILVLAPKKIIPNWKKMQINNKNRIDDIEFKLFSHSDLRLKGKADDGSDLAQMDWWNFDLIVIDESHNFRNNKNSLKYDFLINNIISKGGIRPKILMLSATPVNNKINDLKSQLELIYGDSAEDFSNKLNLEKNINKVMSDTQTAFTNFNKKPNNQKTKINLEKYLSDDFKKVLDSLTIARSKKHIEKYYSNKKLGRFPEKMKNKDFHETWSENENFSFEIILDEIEKLNLAFYSPLKYVLPSKKDFYSEKYQSQAVNNQVFSQENRDESLKELIKVNFIKRLEASIDSFRITINNLIEKMDATIANIDYSENFEFSREDEIFEDNEDNYTSGKIKINFHDMHLEEWKNDILNDLRILKNLFQQAQNINYEKDLKLKKLIEIIENKIKNPFNKDNKKVLIFTTFKDTANYLYDHIANYFLNKYNIYTAKIEGNANGNRTNLDYVSRSTDDLLSCFSPLSKNRNKIYSEYNFKNIDILIATDALSEGQNLQDCDLCINYDIHWNPVRIIQRFGRIDRIGSINKKIQLINFWPSENIEDYINLSRRVNSKMIMVDFASTGDSNILKDDEKENELSYREYQLNKIKDGDMEAAEMGGGGFSLTDLGYSEFVNDLKFYIDSKEENKKELEKAITGLYAISKYDFDSEIDKGIIFLFKNTKAEKFASENKYNFDPFYLVYVDRKGKIKFSIKDTKKILESLKKISFYNKEPIERLTRVFNEETHNGSDMSLYTSLLNEAINSLTEIKKENSAIDLLTKGSAINNSKNEEFSSSFELMYFMVIK